MRKAIIRLSEWESAIEALLAPEEVPAGWLPSVKIMEMAGMSTSNGSQAMRKLVARGMVEKKMFRIRSGHSIKGVAHYRPKDGWRRLSKS